MSQPADRRQRPVIRLFGSLVIEDGERRLGPRDLGGARPKQVLEILLAARGHLVSIDRLAELVWGRDVPDNAVGSLQTFVSVLRRHLACNRDRARELVVTEPHAYRFATELVTLDLDRFDELLDRSAREPTSRARASLEEALALVRGEVLEDEPYAAWALDLRGSYQGRVLGARLDAADAALAELDYGAALAQAEAAAALNRFSERAHRYELLALYALGRPHEALDRYRRFRTRLADDLGLEPTAETRAVEAAVLRQEDVQVLLPRPIRAPGDSGSRRVRLLGRTRELETLAEAARAALSGDLALIQLEGEPGLGKTRMLEELAAELDGVAIGRAGCSELECHLPYVPLATALREALVGVEYDIERLPALAQVFPELNLGAPKAGFDEVEVLEALVALVGAHAPLVLLLDDIQWADRWTLSALGYLRRRGAGVRAAVVTAGPETGTPAADGIGRLKPDTVVRLEPLSAGDLAKLGMPALHESTGGHPRFVNEALAHGGWSGPSATLTAALLAQCRAEGHSAYRVLVSASVLEQPFEPEPLANLLDVDAAELTEELERLSERRILRVDGFRFRFRYDLVREVLLGSVSPARQRLLRQRLEQTCAETIRAPFGRAVGSQAAG